MCVSCLMKTFWNGSFCILNAANQSLEIQTEARDAHADLQTYSRWASPAGRQICTWGRGSLLGALLFFPSSFCFYFLCDNCGIVCWLCRYSRTVRNTELSCRGEQKCTGIDIEQQRHALQPPHTHTPHAHKHSHTHRNMHKISINIVFIFIRASLLLLNALVAVSWWSFSFRVKKIISWLRNAPWCYQSISPAAEASTTTW